MDERPVDPLASIVADLDQYQCAVVNLAKIMAMDYNALVAEGISPLSASIMVGTRFKAGL